MQEEDYIIKEIEKISVMLMGVLNNFVVKRKTNEIIGDSNYQDFMNDICNETEIDLTGIYHTDTTKYVDELSTEKGFDDKNIEIIADIFVALSEIARKPKNAEFLQKAISLLIYLDFARKTFSYERRLKIKNLEQIVASLNKS